MTREPQQVPAQLCHGALQEGLQSRRLGGASATKRSLGASGGKGPPRGELSPMHPTATGRLRKTCGPGPTHFQQTAAKLSGGRTHVPPVRTGLQGGGEAEALCPTQQGRSGAAGAGVHHCQGRRTAALAKCCAQPSGTRSCRRPLLSPLQVARQLQPSVVWIQDTEKTFYKKVPNTEKQSEPKRLKKQLPKILKLLKPDDRILIVGTTQRPFDAELQSFCKVYQKIILVPRPDYASRYVLWKQVIQRLGGVLTNALNISCLAKVTDGFTQGHVVEVVQSVLSEQRIRQQGRRPLTAGEFIAAITSMNPVYKEEEESFKDWYARTPLGKRRALALMGGTEKETEKEKEKEKKQKKKK
nr:dynein regulatory complex protein 11 [Oryctolagus cuniculus]